jgi:hypothetical protein
MSDKVLKYFSQAQDLGPVKKAPLPLGRGSWPESLQGENSVPIHRRNQ